MSTQSANLNRDHLQVSTWIGDGAFVVGASAP